MNSKITNEYGAFRGPVVNEVEKELRAFETYLKGVCESLGPVDVRLLENLVTMSISGALSGVILHKAVNMSKEARECRKS